MYSAVLECHPRGETTLILELSEGKNLLQVNVSWKP